MIKGSKIETPPFDIKKFRMYCITFWIGIEENKFGYICEYYDGWHNIINCLFFHVYWQGRTLKKVDI